MKFWSSFWKNVYYRWNRVQECLALTFGSPRIIAIVRFAISLFFDLIAPVWVITYLTYTYCSFLTVRLLAGQPHSAFHFCDFDSCLIHDFFAFSPCVLVLVADCLLLGFACFSDLTISPASSVLCPDTLELTPITFTSLYCCFISLVCSLSSAMMVWWWCPS